MAEKLNLVWLKNENGEKIAPKTLTSQVQTASGVPLDDKIKADMDTIRDEAKSYTDNAVSNASASIPTDDHINSLIASAITGAIGGSY